MLQNTILKHLTTTTMGTLLSKCLECFQSNDDTKGPKKAGKRGSSRSSKKSFNRGPSLQAKQPKKQKSISKQHLLSSDNSQGYSSTGNQSPPPPSCLERRPSWGRLPQSPVTCEPPRDLPSPMSSYENVPSEQKTKKSKLNRSISLRVGPSDEPPARRKRGSFRQKKK